MSRTVEREVIERNSAKCLACGDEIESTHRHDFRWCSCKALAVDGGKEYRRRVYNGEYEETSIFTVQMVEVDW